ncbi:MAG: hypothetical protein WC595_01375, partial [Candidatus Nanoarchaeia archaeon]
MNGQEQVLAEFVGILLGDGYIEKEGYEVKVSLDLVEDKGYAPYVKKIFYDLFKIEIKSYPRSSSRTLDLRVSNKNLHNHITNHLGMKKSPKAGKAKIPESLLVERNYPSLLKGYFDTDGCIVDTNNNGTRYPRVEMKICKSPMQ